MKTTLFVLLPVLALFLLAGCPQVNPPGACAQDAKQCPDGSYVGRTGPNCTFASCPNATSCQNYSVDTCPSQCVICPPCAVCSSISCNSKEFCASIGFNSTWYNETQQTAAKIQACINSFGNVTTQLCCKSITEFPDTCLIGACGCSPSDSHDVIACDCGEGRCWSSSMSQCMTPTPIIPSNASEAASVVDANNQFAFDLYSQYKSQSGNIFFSPYSISTALAMTYEGARGATAEEMQAVLHFPLDNNTRRIGFAALYDEINRKDKTYNLSTANALWAQKDYKFLDSYFNLVQTYYGGNVTNLDFIRDTENSRITINNWVEEQTNHKIKNIIPSGAIDSLTRLVLTNAVYFKAHWHIPFLNETNDEDFRVSPDNTIKVKMMSLYGDEVRTAAGSLASMTFNYAETNETQVIELPYEGNEVSMLILLPKGDIQTFEQSLTADKLNHLKAMLNETEMEGIYLPKFKFETKYFMSETLENMGMKKAFDPSEADFSGMDGTKNLYITSVIHQAFIDVNETGTEAAAATVVIMGMTAVPNQPPKPVFRADHPFIFIIQQQDTGNILFMGRVSNPTAG